MPRLLSPKPVGSFTWSKLSRRPSFGSRRKNRELRQRIQPSTPFGQCQFLPLFSVSLSLSFSWHFFQAESVSHPRLAGFNVIYVCVCASLLWFPSTQIQKFLPLERIRDSVSFWFILKLLICSSLYGSISPSFVYRLRKRWKKNHYDSHRVCWPRKSSVSTSFFLSRNCPLQCSSFLLFFFLLIILAFSIGFRSVFHLVVLTLFS